MTPVDHREKAFEDTIDGHLVEHGWASLSPTDFDTKLGLYGAELLAFVRDTQPDEWDRLVTAHGRAPDAAGTALLTRVAQRIDTEGTMAVLRGGVTERGVKVQLMYRRPAHSLNPDGERLYGLNRCGVVRQFRYDETGNEIDLALIVNGVPVATAELKNPLTRQDVQHAIRQYKKDRDPANLTLASRCVVHFAVDPNEAHFTTRLRGQATRFFPFNRGSAPDGDGGAGNFPDEHGSYRTAYLWRDVWQRDAWLDILGRFIHVEKVKSGADVVIFPRYHQWDVVRRLLNDSRERGAGQSYLIQHSAGSGKSNSIAWLAHGLSNLHAIGDEKVFDKVVVITDRVVLDRQLQDTIYQFEHRHGVVEKIATGEGAKSAKLAEALTSVSSRIIITTIQTFPALLTRMQEAGDSLDAGRRYAIIVDEAHSSQTGDTATALKQVLGDAVPAPTSAEAAPGDLGAWEAAQEAQESAEDEAGTNDALDALARIMAARGRQPNISFYAFTATPKGRTLVQFGQPGPDGNHQPYHLYSMRQAIEEKFILDVLQGYTTYAVYRKLQIPEGRADLEVDKSRAAAAVRKYADLHPHALGQKAQVIVEHFREHVAHRLDGQAKAMIVTASRLHAVRYKIALDKYIAEQGYGSEMHALVAFSGEVNDEGEKFTEPGMNGLGEGELPRKFDSPEYQVLIVAEKYQTGFDQPKLVAMYVDKRLKQVAAVQTLSRLNRTYPHKNEVFVLDFVNTTDEIQEAFAPYYTQTTAEPPDPNLLFDAAAELWKSDVLREDEVDDYATTLHGGQGSKAHDKLYFLTSHAVDRFRALDGEEQGKFRDAGRKYQRAYAFLSQVVPWVGVEQEKLYAFIKALLPQIPEEGGSGGDIDLTGVELTHFRLKLQEETDIGLGGPTDPLTVYPGDGTGSKTDAMETIAEIIRRFNETHGLELTDADRIIMVEHATQRLLENDKVRHQAEQNDLATFSLVAKDDLDRVWLETRERSEDLFLKVMTHPALKDALTEAILADVHGRAQEDSSRG